MPSFAHLSDAVVAAVANQERSSWGSDKRHPAGVTPLMAADVTALWKQKLSPAAVHTYRRQAL